MQFPLLPPPPSLSPRVSSRADDDLDRGGSCLGGLNLCRCETYFARARDLLNQNRPVGFAVRHACVHRECAACAAARTKQEAARPVLAWSNPESFAAERTDEQVVEEPARDAKKAVAHVVLGCEATGTTRRTTCSAERLKLIRRQQLHRRAVYGGAAIAGRCAEKKAWFVFENGVLSDPIETAALEDRA